MNTRFQSTLRALRDCADNLCSLDPHSNSLNDFNERAARRELIEICAEILVDIGVENPYDTETLHTQIGRINYEPDQ